jgi:hypothetical protein
VEVVTTDAGRCRQRGVDILKAPPGITVRGRQYELDPGLQLLLRQSLLRRARIGAQTDRLICQIWQGGMTAMTGRVVA